jgi:hypothetical protein
MKLAWADFIITKKKHEKPNLKLTFYDFKSIFIVLLCVLIVDYFFYIYTNIKLFFNLNYNNKKIIVKVKKKSWCLFFFRSILVVLPYNQDKKNIYMSRLYLKITNKSCKKTLISLKINIKFSEWNGKNTIILFQ